MKKVVILFFLLLIAAHQDFWWWHTHEPLVLGFVPIGLAWHVGISLCAAALGLVAMTYCWPTHLDNVEEESR
ncbi:MAG: hypothetical protein HBSAPP02_03610 [Phycisphaerae bacterium]|nr:MAG: hypothetical protein HRU71_11670 [Planctomycetia bacterium]RIK66500.1 MAG: hypothetical protein DCC66_13115 [Planctomycetota bacterium]GJQ25329.1 MAG: hypothetical protein HBSAPP02_03610 [Phycisphaerae bacterium]